MWHHCVLPLMSMGCIPIWRFNCCMYYQNLSQLILLGKRVYYKCNMDQLGGLLLEILKNCPRVFSSLGTKISSSAYRVPVRRQTQAIMPLRILKLFENT